MLAAAALAITLLAAPADGVNLEEETIMAFGLGGRSGGLAADRDRGIADHGPGGSGRGQGWDGPGAHPGRESQRENQRRPRRPDEQRQQQKLRPTPNSPDTRNPQQDGGNLGADPKPMTESEISADAAARFAQIRRQGRGTSVIAAGARLGEGTGPTIRRASLGGL